jgi:biotin carboxylase
MREAVIIVDPFSSGVAYAPELEKRGYDCIAVRSSPDISARLARGFQPGHFIGGQLFDIETALKRFSGRRIKAVVAGCEMGVAVAEALAARLQLPGNCPETTPLRRLKHAMQLALAEGGLNCIPSMLNQEPSQMEELLSGIEEGCWVVKPVNSAMTDGVMFAQGRQGVADALGRCAWNQTNDLGEKNLGFIVQPFVQGTEYVIDLVAHQEGLSVSSVCRYRKQERNGSSFVYEGLDALEPSDPAHRDLIDYAMQAARAVGLQLGPLHMELLAGPEGPVMIEAGARLHGGVAPELFRDCYSPHLLERSVSAYLGNAGPVTQAQLIERGHIAFLVNDGPRQFTADSRELLERLRALRTYRGHRFFFSEGQNMPATVDLATCPGIVWLAGGSEMEIDSDARICRSLELGSARQPS